MVIAAMLYGTGVFSVLGRAVNPPEQCIECGVRIAPYFTSYAASSRCRKAIPETSG
jgi:hypothetical protein